MDPYLIWLHPQPSGYTAGVAFAPDDHRIARKAGDRWTFVTGPLCGLEVVEWYRHRLPQPEPVPAAEVRWLEGVIARLSGRRTVEHVLGGIVSQALVSS